MDSTSSPTYPACKCQKMSLKVQIIGYIVAHISVIDCPLKQEEGENLKRKDLTVEQDKSRCHILCSSRQNFQRKI